MNRLWVQLTLAFALVILLTVGTIALLADLTAGQAFRRYLSYSDSALHQTLEERLAAYYEVYGSWDGVESILERTEIVAAPMPRPMEPGRHITADRRAGRFQIVLADAGGRIVYDSQEGRSDRKLTRDERAAARDIEVGGEVVGQFVIAWPVGPAALGPLEQAFIARLRQLLVVGALLAGGLGVLLGLTFSRSLTAPLQRLVTAARAVANRDFGHRLEVEGSVELAEVAQAFNEMSAALAQSEQQRQNMVADVAHELRSPLSVVQGNLQAILDDVYALDKAEISRLYDETRLLSRLVDDLRELALADAGQLRLDLQPIDAVQLIQATTASLAPVAEMQELILSSHAPPDLPAVQADADRLAQILRNLLINALRHTPPGGAVTVTASRTGGAVEIAVADTGEGIAPEDLPHVFDRFWRADPSRARTGRGRSGGLDERRASGSGLGLSVAQSLVEAQGGRIRAESALGEGSTFRFTLPLSSD
jgi:two-component system OmpR family sensor kinase